MSGRKRGHSCSDCLHIGCCDDDCGGSRWQDAYTECRECGQTIRVEDCEIEECGKFFCSLACYLEWMDEHDCEEDEQ